MGARDEERYRNHRRQGRVQELFYKTNTGVSNYYRYLDHYVVLVTPPPTLCCPSDAQGEHLYGPWPASGLEFTFESKCCVYNAFILSPKVSAVLQSHNPAAPLRVDRPPAAERDQSRASSHPPPHRPIAVRLPASLAPCQPPSGCWAPAPKTRSAQVHSSWPG